MFTKEQCTKLTEAVQALYDAREALNQVIRDALPSIDCDGVLLGVGSNLYKEITFLREYVARMYVPPDLIVTPLRTVNTKE